MIFLVYEALSQSNESVMMDFLASRQILLREFSWVRAYVTPFQSGQFKAGPWPWQAEYQKGIESPALVLPVGKSSSRKREWRQERLL